MTEVGDKSPEEVTMSKEGSKFCLVDGVLQILYCIRS